MRTVTLNEKQQRRIDILIRLDAGSIDVPTAANLLGVSARHIRRMRARFQQKGMEAALHGNQHRSPSNRTDPMVIQDILELAGPHGKYHDLNICHLKDMLAQEEQIIIGRSTLDRLLRHHGLRGKARPTKTTHRRRRARRNAEGMLLQMDGSPFEWLQERGMKMVLLGAVDDATSKIIALLFRPTEDQAGYLYLLRAIAQTHGLPMAIYHDRHTILRSPKQPTLEEELAGQRPMSQVQRLLTELGIESIPAYSPQAKGRVERLWETLQDRLVKEMRLAGISTLEAANAFLPNFIERYNARFAKSPQDPQNAWVSLPDGFDLPYYFACRETRKVRADHCIQYQGKLLQLQVGPRDPSLSGKNVTVHMTPEGMIYVYHGRCRLDHQQVVETGQPPEQSVRPVPAPKVKVPRATARQRAWLFGHG
jgi:transposase